MTDLSGYAACTQMCGEKRQQAATEGKSVATNVATCILTLAAHVGRRLA